MLLILSPRLPGVTATFWIPNKKPSKRRELLAAAPAGSPVNPANRVMEAGGSGRLAGIYYRAVGG